MVAWLLVMHVFGFTLWISGLIMTSFVLLRHIDATSPESRASLAGVEKLGLRALADPGAFLAILAGILLILTNRAYYLHARWLHIKLIFVVLLIILHVILGTRSKAFAAGRITLDRGYVRLLSAVVILIFISILIATLPGEVFLTR
ncbi:MAG TPA: CopD family protein [Candidatus Acidoferrales bacterium]|jgi:putative membrane protein|nr:CopD family protein [Candidatus Acidoferrales bacterium]